MTLSEEARKRLADVVALQPTKNAELQEQWGLADGSAVHRYLESELEEYYYRDENSLIRATDRAAEVVGVEPAKGDRTLTVPELQRQVIDVLAGPDERSQSVVAVLHALRDAYGIDPDVDAVRSALRSLADRDVVETVRRTVPTFRLAVDREDLEVEVLEAEA